MVMMMTVRLNNIWLHIVFSHILGPGLNQQLKKFILFIMPIMRPYSPWNLRNYLRTFPQVELKIFLERKARTRNFLTTGTGNEKRRSLRKSEITCECQNYSLVSNNLSRKHDIRRYKQQKRTLKTVRLTSFQSPQFQSACSSLPASTSTSTSTRLNLKFLCVF